MMIACRQHDFDTRGGVCFLIASGSERPRADVAANFGNRQRPVRERPDAARHHLCGAFLGFLGVPDRRGPRCGCSDLEGHNCAVGGEERTGPKLLIPARFSEGGSPPVSQFLLPFLAPSVVSSIF